MNYYTNPHFDGIYSIDTLKNIKEKPELIICNTDPSDKPGEHWVLFFFDNDGSVDFYNSLGRDINFYGSEFHEICYKEFETVYGKNTTYKFIFMLSILFILCFSKMSFL